jgi:hypothetical protein
MTSQGLVTATDGDIVFKTQDTILFDLLLQQGFIPVQTDDDQTSGSGSGRRLLISPAATQTVSLSSSTCPTNWSPIKLGYSTTPGVDYNACYYSGANPSSFSANTATSCSSFGSLSYWVNIKESNPPIGRTVCVFCSTSSSCASVVLNYLPSPFQFPTSPPAGSPVLTPSPSRAPTVAPAQNFCPTGWNLVATPITLASTPAVGKYSIDYSYFSTYNSYTYTGPDIVGIPACKTLTATTNPNLCFSAISTSAVAIKPYSGTYTTTCILLTSLTSAGSNAVSSGSANSGLRPS